MATVWHKTTDQLKREHAQQVKAAGSAAFRAGVAYVDCPYAMHDPDRGLWCRGWIDEKLRGTP